MILKGERGPAPVWIDNEVIRVSGRDEHAARRVLDFMKREARLILEHRSRDYASRIGAKVTRVAVRDPASRWGSCAVSGAISYSWRLIFAPDFVLDYVVAHEVAHLREMNHGPRFWKLVRQLAPDIETPQTWLRQHGIALHRYAAKG
jgi:predicted metal-dependent hydrolase